MSAHLTTGLVSVTFRKLSPAEIVALCAHANLDAVEWGGDIHVPHGDIVRARDVGALTRDAGLAVAAYGSYYRVGAAGQQPANPSFDAVLDTASALGAPLIQVWAGVKGSADSDPADRERVAADLRRICALAVPRGIDIALEYHSGTLTDTFDSTAALLADAASPNLRTLWQPRTADRVDENCDELTAFLPQLANVHVFHWPQGDPVPLAAGRAAWTRYVALLATDPAPRALLLEFVASDSPDQFLADAATLREIVNAIQQ